MAYTTIIRCKHALVSYFSWFFIVSSQKHSLPLPPMWLRVSMYMRNQLITSIDVA